MLKELLCGLEVGQEVVVWLHGDYLAVLSPDLLEQREQELAPLGGLGLQVPEAGWSGPASLGDQTPVAIRWSRLV